MGFQVKGAANWPTDLGPRMLVGLTDAQHVAGQSLVKHVQDGMRTGKKSGRVYRHPSGGTYQASGPVGEYSAVVTGRLLRSVGYRASGQFYIVFYATADHAGFQERGTWKMAARENLKRAIDESEGNIRNILDQCLRRAIGR